MNLPNTENLIPNSQRTPSELRALAKKAGQASGKARRERKAMRDDLIALLSGKIAGETIQEMGLSQMVADWLKPDTSTSERVQLFDRISRAIGEQGADKQLHEAVNVEAVKITFADKSDRSKYKGGDPKIVGDTPPPKEK